MPGMRERAQLMGGTLTISSKLDSGTQIEITIPAALSYLKTRMALGDPANRPLPYRKRIAIIL